MGLRVEDSQYPNSRAESDASQKASTSKKHNDEEQYTLNGRFNGPPLPLYHPRGGLALSLPELDPAEFGLPNPINIDDSDVRVHDGDTSRRASSRARRPPAKLRDRDAGEEEDPAAANDMTNGARKTGELQARAASPRKRRSGGGTKRKRREDDADGTYPNPPKRSRNPRGAAGAVASPLADAAAAPAEDVEMDAAPATNVPDADEARSDVAEEQKPTTRSRRKPAAPKRRGSSASETTATSISVSIAMNARKPRSLPGPARPEDEKDEAETAPLPPAEPPEAARPPAPQTNKSGSDTSEKPMELSTPPETVAEVLMAVEKIIPNASIPDKALKDAVGKLADREHSATTDDPAPKEPPPPPPRESDTPADSRGVAKDTTQTSTTPTIAELTKDTRAPTQAPADSKPPPSPGISLRAQDRPPKNEPPRAVAKPVEKPAVKPAAPAPVEEKEEGELSEDG